jgi:hypothetical protein
MLANSRISYFDSMTYLLFFLSIGLTTTLILVVRRLQQLKKDREIDRQRLLEADRKYGGLFSKEDAVRELDREANILTERIEQINKQGKADEELLLARSPTPQIVATCKLLLMALLSTHSFVARSVNTQLLKSGNNGSMARGSIYSADLFRG